MITDSRQIVKKADGRSSNTLCLIRNKVYNNSNKINMEVSLFVLFKSLCCDVNPGFLSVISGSVQNLINTVGY